LQGVLVMCMCLHCDVYCIL